MSAATTLEYARIGSLIDPDEVIGLGIYPARGGKPKWRQITYHRTASLRHEIEAPIPSYGAVQGILHAWYKEARDPNFLIRELSSDTLVRVHYPSDLYSDVAQAVQERTTMLIVAGNMLFNRVTHEAIELRADRIERIRMLSTAEFESFFGSAPEFVADYGDDEDSNRELNG